MMEQTAPFSFGVDFDCASYHPVISADIHLVHDLDDFNHLMFIFHDEVDFVKRFVVWTTPGPSPFVLLFEERVHDLKAVGNSEADEIIASIISIIIPKGAYTFFISASNLCVKVTDDDLEVGLLFCRQMTG